MGYKRHINTSLFADGNEADDDVAGLLLFKADEIYLHPDGSWMRKVERLGCI
jgi:hypothetical protein